MREPRSGVRTAERVAGVVAVIAALVVLNGAWVNQHNWQNISWRVAMAGVLVVLAAVVETNAFGLLQPHRSAETNVLPEFMRAGEHATAIDVEREASGASSEAVGSSERR